MRCVRPPARCRSTSSSRWLTSSRSSTWCERASPCTRRASRYTTPSLQGGAMPDAPRRTKLPAAPSTPTGYRQTRRGSKAARTAEKAEKRYQRKLATARAGRGFRNVLIIIGQFIAGAIAIVLVLLLLATAVNTYTRWSLQRRAEKAASPSEQQKRAKENILVIGAEGDDANGYLALRVDSKGKQVFGIAIPDGAFLDVPGQGFERVGEAYKAGPDVAASAVSNYLGVPFNSWVVVPTAVYKDALTKQSVLGIVEAQTNTNLTPEQLDDLTRSVKTIAQKNVALVPMPVKPIKLGEQTYFEPQRQQIADLLKSWWGIDPQKADQATRVIVYNGAGKPGIAGEAAQVLIRRGFRVVDTKNADSFKYKTTRVVVRRGNAARGQAVADALGVGKVSVEPSDEDVTDVIVIIGKDYRPPAAEGGTQ
ncbi:MAG: LytR family transcriptional regulator [Actinobacteria bacterium]|nr:MAG: LytR family transcriptional regulator [Actinomycetota bacterium]